MNRRRKAYEFFCQAHEAQLHGRLGEAVTLYRRSLRLHPTAEAWTLLGWVLSLLGRPEAAICFCLRAIKLDPHLSNPYSDIGAYLVQLDRGREAMSWLLKACEAGHYTHHYCALYNLGRIYECLGDESRALSSYRLSLEDCPDCELTRQAYWRLIGRTN